MVSKPVLDLKAESKLTNSVLETISDQDLFKIQSKVEKTNISLANLANSLDDLQSKFNQDVLGLDVPVNVVMFVYM